MSSQKGFVMRIFGFDLGIASIGWAVVDINKENKDSKSGPASNGKIIASGVRIFDIAENPKDGKSLAAPRRLARGLRRILRRRARRMTEIRELLKKYGFQAQSLPRAGDIDVWKLRAVDVFERKLDDTEIARVLIHIAKHRGYKSAKKSGEESDIESGKVLNAIAENKNMLGNHKTMAQMIFHTRDRKRNRGKITKIVANKKGIEKTVEENYYGSSIPRDEIIREAKIVFEAQGLNFYDEYAGIAFRHRLFNEGPDPKKFATPAKTLDAMIGTCTFEPDESRAPKEAPTAELFVALTKIHNTKIIIDGKTRFFTEEERMKTLGLLKEQKDVKYSSLNKKIFDGKAAFPDIYGKDEKETKFFSMSGFHKLKNALKDFPDAMENFARLDRIMTIVATEKTDDKMEAALSKADIPDDWREAIKKLTSDRFNNLSLKALYKIVPEMTSGKKYNEACESVGYDFRKGGDELVSVREDRLLDVITDDKMTNVPAVNRTIAQFRKVYNAMAREYGQPDQTNLEIGRELKKSHDERKQIEKQINENNAKNEAARENLSQFGIEPTGTNLLKYKLYMEQNCKCVYSGTQMTFGEFDNYEIDHILPFSRSLDDSFNNKVLVLRTENQRKGNKTPWEYMQDNWTEFEERVRTIQNPKKRANLLNKEFSETENEMKFRERNANDNAYISRFVGQYLKDGSGLPNERICVRTGSLTAYLRHQWGLEKNRNKSDRHHAQDAIVIACATQGMVQYLSNWSAIMGTREAMTTLKEYDMMRKRFAEPWTGFRNEIAESLNKIFVSRSPRRKASGQIHLETIYNKNGATNKEPKKIAIKSGIPIRGGLAANGEMLRIDVFSKKNKTGRDKFYFIPIYLSQMGRELPVKVCTANILESEWPEIDDSAAFRFSIYKNDLIRTKKGDAEYFGYYDGADRSTAAISIVAPDRQWTKRGVGIQNLDIFEKYQVDMLGNYVKVNSEQRQNLIKGKKGQSKGNKNGMACPSTVKTV
ncbi:MAG: type II CRISPR RNA-guided endonuclease Cas9 [Rickettsiales bacterium]|jgi:CRISPR-associated endonuclease Csn1|nr:type II CRISPR RNA-guided endonuclease Cas9 [Rickettsiales bacterium]